MEKSQLDQYRRRADWEVRPDSQEAVNVSVIIPTYNVCENLRNTLLSLNQQTYTIDKIEVIVVDNGSNDATRAMLLTLDVGYSLRYYFEERMGRQVGKCRNIGIANAVGDIIIFTDADCLCSPNLVTTHVALHRCNEQRIVVGDIRMLDPNGYILNTKITLESLQQERVPTQANWKAKIKQSLEYWFLEARYLFNAALTVWMTGAHSSVKRCHVCAVGGYDEQFDLHWGDEDAELGYRLQKKGLTMCFTYDALIFHQWHESSRSGIPGYNRILLLLKHPELINIKLLMRADNKYYRKNVYELENELHNVNDETKNNY